jgi:hypothetical protein
MQPALAIRCGIVEHIDLRILAHVGALDERALRRQPGSDTLQFGERIAGQNDGSALVGKALRDRFADSRTGPGHDDHLVDESLHASSGQLTM